MKKLTLLLSVFVATGLILSAQSKLTPEQALKALKDGNKRYVENNRTYTNQDKARIDETSTSGQHPYATIIGCSDSRVPIEHVFDAGIGDLFVIRVAGNVCDTDEVGSIEYGVKHLHTPVFVVLGHTQCGAVTAVAKNAEVHGSIPKLVDNIAPAVEKAKKSHGHEANKEMVGEAIKLNVWQSIEDLLHRSHDAVKLAKAKKLLIVGAVYHLETGKVEWLGEHPKLAKLLEHGAHDHHHAH